MTREEFFRLMSKKLLEIKAIVDNFEEGCEYLTMSIVGDHVSFNNDPKKENSYGFWFRIGQDIENGEIHGDGRNNWIADDEEF